MQKNALHPFTAEERPLLFEGFKGAITADWILLAKGPVRKAFPATAIQDKILLLWFP